MLFQWFTIAELDSRKEIKLAFDFLCRKISFDEMEAQDFLINKIKVDRADFEAVDI